MSDVFYASDLFCAFLLGLILKSGIDLIRYYICELIRRKWRKECNFDCSNCKVFDCDRHDCLAQKKNYERKLKKKELMNK
jgi:hypothetical protein